MSTTREYATPSELAEEIHVSEATLRQWRWQNQGPPYVKVGTKRVVYRRADVARWLDAQTVTPGAA